MNFLRYVKADFPESVSDFHDDFVESLQRSVRQVKENRTMEERYMRLRELIAEERKEGRAEGRAEAIICFLSCFGEVPAELHTRIMEERDVLVLNEWTRLAAAVDSIQQFEENM